MRLINFQGWINEQGELETDILILSYLEKQNIKKKELQKKLNKLKLK